MGAIICQNCIRPNNVSANKQSMLFKMFDYCMHKTDVRNNNRGYLEVSIHDQHMLRLIKQVKTNHLLFDEE